jgi:hypothetical protein
MHEAYDNKTFQNDIAILKTSQPVKFSESVQPISLPTSHGINYVNEIATVTGWGTIYFGGPISPKLKGKQHTFFREVNQRNVRF